MPYIADKSCYLSCVRCSSVTCFARLDWPSRGDIPLRRERPLSAQSFIQNGRLRALGIAGDHRAATLPELPTFVEAVLKDDDAALWYSILVPACEQVLATPSVRERRETDHNGSRCRNARHAPRPLDGIRGRIHARSRTAPPESPGMVDMASELLSFSGYALVARSLRPSSHWRES